MRFFAVLVLVLAMGEPARASESEPQCECLDERRVRPRDESTGVSPEAKIWINSDLPGKVTLFGPLGARDLGVVPKPPRSLRDPVQYQFDPGPLEPEAEYWIHIDGYGEVVRFTTAREPTPVAEPVIRRFEAATITYESLPPDHALDLDLSVPIDAVAVELTVRNDRESRTIRTKPDGWYDAMTDPICAREFDAPAGTVVCLDVTAIGPGENRSSTTTNCITAGAYTHDDWDATRLPHFGPSCRNEEKEQQTADVGDPTPFIAWTLGVLAFVLSLGRIAWQSRAPRSARPGEAFIVARVAQRALAISRAIAVAAAIACIAAITSGELTEYVSCVLGLAVYDVVRYARARHVMGAAQAGAACAIGDGYVGVDDTWLYVRRSAIERAEAPAVPAARAVR